MKISVIHKQVRKYTKDNTRHYSGNTKKNHSPVFHLFAWQEENHLRDPGKKKETNNKGSPSNFPHPFTVLKGF